MHTACLNIAQRETFNQLANRDMCLDRIRTLIEMRDGNYEKWNSDECEIFWLTTEEKDALLSVWHIITPEA